MMTYVNQPCNESFLYLKACQQRKKTRRWRRFRRYVNDYIKFNDVITKERKVNDILENAITIKCLQIMQEQLSAQENI